MGAWWILMRGGDGVPMEPFPWWYAVVFGLVGWFGAAMSMRSQRQAMEGRE